MQAEGEVKWSLSKWPLLRGHWSCRDASAKVARKVQESQGEELRMKLFELHHSLLSGNPFCSLR